MRERTQAKPTVFVQALLLWGLVLASCSDGLLMDSSTPANRAAVSQLGDFKAGQVQLATEDLPLVLSGVTEATWKVTLVSSQNAILLQRTLVGTEKAVPHLGPDDWDLVLASTKATARVVLKVEVVSKGKEPYTAEVPFFLFKKLPELSISTVPVEVEPAAWLGSQAWLAAEDVALYAHGGWIVWKVAGKVLTEGPLQERALFWWKAQTQAGTSEMSAEWYPEPPSTSADEVLPAPVTVVSRPVVTTTPRPISGELVPEDSYDSLWHFRGTLTNRTNGKGLGTTGVSETSWTINHGSLAAWIPENTQWTGPGIEALQNQWRPFTLNMVYKPSSTDADIVLWQTLDKSGKPLLQIRQTVGNTLVARIVTPTGMMQDVGGKFVVPQEFTAISLAVFPSGPDWAVTWSMDGVAVQTGLWTKAFGLPESLGGVSQLWTGPALWDEAGLYIKTPQGVNSTDPQVFARAREDQYGSDLILAEGFDGLVAPAGWTIPQQNGSLAAVLLPDEFVRSAPVTVPTGTLEFRVNVVGVKGGLTIRALDTEGRVVWTGATVPSNSVITWNRQDAGAATVRIEWKNTGTEPLSLDELTIIRKME